MWTKKIVLTQMAPHSYMLRILFIVRLNYLYVYYAAALFNNNYYAQSTIACIMNDMKTRLTGSDFLGFSYIQYHLTYTNSPLHGHVENKDENKNDCCIDEHEHMHDDNNIM